MSKIIINTKLCKGCRLCMDACPKKLIIPSGQINHNGYETVKFTDSKRCVGCGFCRVMCPDVCIEVIAGDKAK